MVKRKIETKKLKKYLIGVIVLLVVFIVVGMYINLYNNEEKIDSNYLINTLREASELTTAELNYTGLSQFTDSGIKFINRSDFRMIYKATARIGIRVEEVRIELDKANKTIDVYIPKAEVLDVKVDSSSIEYFDENFAVINYNEKEDANKAIVLAEEEARIEINKMGGLQMADNQAEALIKGILINAIPSGYTIETHQEQN